MGETEVHVSDDADALAAGVASRLLTRLAAAQAARGSASVVLTGGRIADRVYSAMAGDAERDRVDWGRVDVWWGDERFLPAGHPDRNQTQAHASLLDALPFAADRVHPMPAAEDHEDHEAHEGHDELDAAAASYAATLAAAAVAGSSLPTFDVILLGVGEDGHVASVFPGLPAVADSRPVAAVRDSPKPPPNRITFTVSTINTGAEVWLIAAGVDKANAVGLALAGNGAAPAALVHGTERTVWLLDQGAAGRTAG